MSATCRTCPWWRDEYGRPQRDPEFTTYGFCRRMPPTQEVRGERAAQFPEISGDEWCGEHPQRKEEP